MPCNIGRAWRHIGRMPIGVERANRAVSRMDTSLSPGPVDNMWISILLYVYHVDENILVGVLHTNINEYHSQAYLSINENDAHHLE